MLGIQKTAENAFALYCIDGLNLTKKHTAFFKEAKALLGAMYPGINFSIQRKSILIPKQSNEFDCGYIACAMTDRLANGEKGIKQLLSLEYLSNDKCNYNVTRSYVVDKLIKYAKNNLNAARKPPAPILHQVRRTSSPPASLDDDIFINNPLLSKIELKII